MKMLILALGLLGSLHAATTTPPPSLTDADRLRLREAELLLSEANTQRSAAESAYYQAVVLEGQARAALDAIAAEIGKKADCEINLQSVQCKPPQAASVKDARTNGVSSAAPADPPMQ